MAKAPRRNGAVEPTVWNCSAITVRAMNSTARISQRLPGGDFRSILAPPRARPSVAVQAPRLRRYITRWRRRARAFKFPSATNRGKARHAA
ncbi:MAG: hypothetical protein P8Y53_22045 [Pseudolabrys sp.]